MKRIIFDTQSNPLLHGAEAEQNYDQRGGLCQLDKGHIVVTTRPYQPDYIEYWKSLGFTIPHLITAGPFDPQYTLSELVVRKKAVRKTIRALANDTHSRLEFYYIEETERALCQSLGIPAYCNFDVSIPLSRKIFFKKICKALSLATPPWFFHKDKDQLFQKAKNLLLSETSILLKGDKGTGGISYRGMFEVSTTEELETAFESLTNFGKEFFIEKRIDHKAEISLHWEITEQGELRQLGLFDRIMNNCSYVGGSYPDTIPFSVKQQIESQLRDKVGPYLIQQGAKGYFHCDIIIDKQNIPYWIDFNPRKGALLYIWDMARRLSEICFGSSDFSFWHEPLQISSNKSFHEIITELSDLIRPGKKPFVVITNPGVIESGSVDVTGISENSKKEAREIFEEAKRRLTFF
ncbi:ATP-grasp domain-containing protein [Desulfonema magnum]|nr:ATP-grasp domain-containing protein [Desulfonema magnum]